MFSCEYWEISKSTRFEEHLSTAASEETLGNDWLELSSWRVALTLLRMEGGKKAPLPVFPLQLLQT